VALRRIRHAGNRQSGHFHLQECLCCISRMNLVTDVQLHTHSTEQRPRSEAKDLSRIKKFLSLYETLRFIALYGIYHYSTSWAKWIESTPSSPFCLESILRLLSFYYLPLVIPSGTFSLDILYYYIRQDWVVEVDWQQFKVTAPTFLEIRIQLQKT
jgi:hypothetical protein